MTDSVQIARKMSKSQRELLVGGGSCVRAYRPAQKLVELGLWDESDDEYTIWPRITPLGTAVRTILLQVTPDA